MQPSQSRGCVFLQLPAELTSCCVCHMLSLVQRRHQRPGPEEQIALIHQCQRAEDWPILDNRIVDLQTTRCSFMVWPQMWNLIALCHSFLWVKRSCGTDVRISELLVPGLAEINSLKSIIWNVLSQTLHMWPYASVSSCSGGSVLVASIMRDSTWREVIRCECSTFTGAQVITVIGTSYLGGGAVRKDVSPLLLSFKHSFSFCTGDDTGRRNSPDVATFLLSIQVFRFVRNEFLFCINYSAMLVIDLSVVTKCLTRSSLKKEGWIYTGLQCAGISSIMARKAW